MIGKSLSLRLQSVGQNQIAKWTGQSVSAAGWKFRAEPPKNSYSGPGAAWQTQDSVRLPKIYGPNDPEQTAGGI